jgi:hypothetical protein
MILGHLDRDGGRRPGGLEILIRRMMSTVE